MADYQPPPRATFYTMPDGSQSSIQMVVGPDGTLTYTGHTPTGGVRPRFFTLGPKGGRLYAANQDSDDITVFAIDSATGDLSPTGVRIKVGSPSAISIVTPS